MIKKSALILVVMAVCVSSRAEQSGAADVRVALEIYNRIGERPLPVPADTVLAEIAAGRAVHVRERHAMVQADGQQQDRIRIVGYRLVPRPRLSVWLATLDIGTEHSRRVTEHLVEGDDLGGSIWYQHINTPWPVRDRHWVIRNQKDLALARLSDAGIWEHRWQLEAGGEALAERLLASGQVTGLSAADGRRSIYLAVNRGAWTMFELDENRTLVAAHTAAVMGGWIPESWVASFVARNLHKILDKLEDRADSIHERYTGAYVVYTGAGRRISPAMAVAARHGYEQRAIGGQDGKTE